MDHLYYGEMGEKHKDLHIALFVATLNSGGAEKMMVNLANGFAGREIKTDLVLSAATGPYLKEVDSKVNLFDLGSTRISKSIGLLRKYLKANRPDILISTQVHVSIAAVIARKTTFGLRTKLIIREASTFSMHSKRRTAIKDRAINALAGFFYRFADGYIAVSEGVRKDLSEFTGIPQRRISLIYNPVVNKRLFEKAEEPASHPWLQQTDVPVILACGRFIRSKDYPTLLRAFRLLRNERMARLIILGDDPDREGEFERVSELARELQLSEDVCFPGFTDNPYVFMKNSAVFVLSSMYEGLPGVLIQAMACGCPVVSTDCPSGPAEVLENGRYGQLVPVGDHQMMAQAMLRTLGSKPDRSELIGRAAEFSVDISIDRHLLLFSELTSRKILLLGPLTNRKNPKRTGGAVVLFNELLRHIEGRGLAFEIIDTNKRNYHGMLHAYTSIVLNILRKLPKAAHISLHSSKDYLLLGPVIILLAKLFGKKVSLRKFGGNLGDDLKTGFTGLVADWIVRRVNYLFVETRVSQGCCSGLNPNTYWFPNSRTRLLPAYRKRSYSRRFVFISHIIKEKGVGEIIEAAKKLDDSYTIHLYGPLTNNGYNPFENNDGKVKYMGELNAGDVPDTMNCYDVLLLPSYKEGYPGIILEAYSLGIPIISTRLDSVMEICQDGVQGRLIRPGSSEQLLRAIRSFNEENYQEYSRNSFGSFSRFDSANTTRRFLNTITDMAGAAEERLKTKQKSSKKTKVLKHRKRPQL